MAVSLKHAFTSNVADSGDATLVQPSNWNAEHNLTAAANTLLGAITTGNVIEITCTSAGRDLLDDANASAQRTTLGLGSISTQNANSVSITGGTIVSNASGVSIFDSDGSNTLTFAVGSNLTSNTTLTLTTGATANRTLDISASNVTISTAGAALIDDADAATQRTTLGLGTSDRPSFAGLDANGYVTGNITAVAALDINCTLGNYFTKTINANSTFTFSNAPSSKSYSFTLELTQTSGAVTWPTAVKWPGGVTPSLTTGFTHLFMFVTDDAGTTWRGASLTNYTS